MKQLTIYVIVLTFLHCNKSIDIKQLNAEVKYTKINSKGKYINGIEDGFWEYQIDGKPIKSGNYQNGLKTGLWKYYDTDTTYNVNWEPVKVSENVKISLPEKFVLENGTTYIYKHEEALYGNLELKFHSDIDYLVYKKSISEYFNKKKLPVKKIKEIDDAESRYYLKTVEFIDTHDNDVEIIYFSAQYKDIVIYISFKFYLKHLKINEAIFLDILYNLQINNTRCFPFAISIPFN